MELTFMAAFGDGLASFLTPCVLPLVPVYLASLAGPEMLETGVHDRKGLFLASLGFVTGFSLIFTSAGALAGLAGVAIGPDTPAVRIISGSVLVLLGVIMLLALKVPFLNFEKRLTPRVGATGHLFRPVLTGGSFALAWTPCLGPVLGGILMLAFNSSTALTGASLLAVYSLGLSLPFLAAGLAFSALYPVIRIIRRYSAVIYVTSGIVLIAAGILVFTGRLGMLY